MDDFNEEFYLALYPDVAAAVANGDFSSGEDHFQQVGQEEGRLGAPENVIDFEDYENFQLIGTAEGISFSDNAIALVDTDAEGEGNFGDNPSGDTIVAYAEGDSIILTLASGPVTEGGVLSFYYSSPNQSHEVIFLDSTGAVVGDPQLLEATTGELNQFTNWQMEIIPFEGNVSAIQLGSAATQIGLDDISIDIRGAQTNQPPIALDDFASVTGSIPTTIAVLDNDSDPDGNELTVIGFAATSVNGGTISQNGDQLIYVAPLDFAGTDSFIYTISDGRGAQDTATVTVAVTAVNPPVAQDDTAGVSSGGEVTIDVLGNDFDLEGTTIAIAGFQENANNGGAVSLADNETPEDPTDDFLSYTAPDGFTGTDSFTYTVTDDVGLTDTATVSVTVTVGNGSISGTKFQDDNGNGVQDSDEDVISGVTIFLDSNDDGQLSEDEQSVVTDTDGNYIFTDLEPGTYIVREVVPDGFSQTFPSGGGGLVGDGFADVVLDFAGEGFDAARVEVILGSDTVGFLSLPEGEYVTVGFTDEIVVDGPGDDIFIREQDGAGERADVFVSSDVNAEFEEFTFLGTANSGTTTAFDLASIGFTEPVQAIRIVGLDDGGSSPGFDVINVQVLPQSIGSGNHVVTIDAGENVEDLDFGNVENQSPVAVDDAGVITDADTPVTIDVLLNDLDPDGNPISLISFGATTTNGGTVSRDNNNTPENLTDDSLIYTPPEDFAGTDTITYTISDGLGAADIGNVNITVAGDNLLVNGSFEEGPNPGRFLVLSSGSTDIVGWTVTRDTIDYNGTFLEASDGSRSIDLDGSPGFGGIAQTFSTIPGQDYLVTFDLAGNPGGPPPIKQMRLEAAGQSADFSFDTTGRSRSDLGWQAQSWQFTAEDTSTTIEFFSLNTEGGVDGPTLDNVSVVASTSPQQPLDLAGEWQYSSPEDFTILSTGFSDGAPAFAAPFDIIQNGNQVTITGFYLNSTGSGTGVISGNNITATLPVTGGTGELVGTISANGRTISGIITFSDGQAGNSTAIIDFTMTSQLDGGNDIINGDAGDNLLTAAVGDDFISGFAGNDSLDGGAGNDTLDSGASTTTVEGETDELDLTVTAFSVGDAPIDLVAVNLSIEALGTQIEDLFIVTANSGSDDLSLLQSNGDGTFTNFPLPLPLPEGVTVSSLTAADEDGDGNAEFLAGTNIENNTIVGVRTTLETFEFDVGDSPVSVALADFNGDGNIDGATANRGDDTVTILTNINNEDATSFNIDVGTAPSYITAADIDGDSDQDLIVVNNGSNSILVLSNDGAGNFQITSESAVGNSPVWVTAADLNGDGAIDLAVANSEDDSISLLRNNGSSFSETGIIEVGSNPVSVTATDLDEDGDIDLAVVNGDDNNVSVWRNNGNANFSASVTVTVGSNPASVTAADLDEDGDIDLAVANEGSDDVSVILNNGLVPVSDGEGDDEGDTVTGGAGTDSFFLNGPEDGFDIITDFVPAEDTLLVSQDVFGDAFTLGTLDETQFTLGTAATTPDQRFIYDIDTGTLFFDADGNGSAIQVQLVVLTAGIEISTADILVVESVTVPNRPPVAASDRATIAQNTTGTIDVLSNDFDLDGDPISLTGFEGTSANGGNVTRNDDRLVYTPAVDFTGTDSFSYSISDGQGTDTGTVTLSVGQASPPDQPDPDPTSDLSVTASVSNSTPDEGEAIAYSIQVSGLSTASNIELRAQLPAGLNLQYTTTSLGVYDPNTGIWRISTLPAGRTATLELNAEVGSGIAGETLVNEVEVISPSGVDNQGTVPIVISGDNQAPIATDDEVTTDVGTPLAVEVLANDSDPDGDSLEVTGVGVAENGDTSIISNQVIYRPDAEFAGTESFVYTISDGRGGTDTATVTVTVGSPENQNPTAVPDSAIASVGQTISIDVLTNDFDLDEEAIGLVAFRRQTAAGGTVVRNNNGTARNIRDDFLEYTPAAGFTGTDRFAYRIRDRQGNTDTARVTVTVNGTGTNQAPIAVDDNVSGTADTSLDIFVVDNDIDPEGDLLSITGVASPTNSGGTVNILGDALVYTPASGFAGTDSFSYTIADSQGLTASANVTVSVSGETGGLNGSISGTTFADANSNGIQDGGELGLTGFTIFLDSDSNGVLDSGEISVVTGANGNYFFGDLPAASYNVQAIGQSDFISSSSNLVIVVLAQGQDFSGVNFGYQGGSTTVEDLNILGSPSSDNLVAGAGNDNLTGGLGNDTLTGGTGSDRFIFNSPDEGVDLITDFEVFSDAIGVFAAGFGGGLISGNLDPNQFTLGVAATDPNHRFIYGNDGSLFFDADGTGAIGEVQIGTISGGPGEFSASNIIVL